MAGSKRYHEAGREDVAVDWCEAFHADSGRLLLAQGRSAISRAIDVECKPHSRCE